MKARAIPESDQLAAIPTLMDGIVARISALLAGDRDDMVVKAMSWALRERAKRDRQAAAEFVGTHRAVLAPRALREVHNKKATGLKNPREANVPEK
jgi:3-methyladenine DNA glycosylase AlkD